MSNGDTGTSRGGRRQRDVSPRRADRHDERYADDQYDEDEVYDDYAPRDRARRLPPAQVAQAGLRHIAELTGKPVNGITSLDRSDTGWVVGVEVVEDRRIPSSTDILAVYRTELDDGGQLVGYRRTQRYPRGRGDTGDAAV